MHIFVLSYPKALKNENWEMSSTLLPYFLKELSLFTFFSLSYTPFLLFFSLQNIPTI